MNDFYKELYNSLYNHHKYSQGVGKPSYTSVYDEFEITKLEDFVKSFIDKDLVWKLLDVGCSTGNFLKYVKEKYSDKCSLWGVDVADKAIEECNLHSTNGLNGSNNDINCTVASVTELPYNDEFFDIIHTTDVLEHLLPIDREKATKEISRVLKKDSLFYGSVATTHETHTLPGSNETLQTYWENYDLDYGVMNLHIDPITAEEWLSIFENNGFEILWSSIYSRKEGWDMWEVPSTDKMGKSVSTVIRDERRGHRRVEDCRPSKYFKTGNGQCHVKFSCRKM